MINLEFNLSSISPRDTKTSIRTAQLIFTVKGYGNQLSLYKSGRAIIGDYGAHKFHWTILGELPTVYFPCLGDKLFVMT